MSAEPFYDIRRAAPEEIPSIAELYLEASRTDNAFKRYWDTSAEFLAGYSAIFQGQIDDPSWAHMVAVDKETGEIIATACWNIPTPDQIAERDERVQREMSEEASSSDDGSEDSFMSVYSAGPTSLELWEGLGAFVDRDSARWISKITQGCEHMVIQGLFTDPAYQGRGVGSALVQYSIDLADALSLMSVVQASAYGWRIYERHGFEIQQTLDIDIRKWVKRGTDDDKGYGNYRFRYMVRLPNVDRKGR